MLYAFLLNRIPREDIAHQGSHVSFSTIFWNFSSFSIIFWNFTILMHLLIVCMQLYIFLCLTILNRSLRICD